MSRYDSSSPFSCGYHNKILKHRHQGHDFRTFCKWREAQIIVIYSKKNVIYNKKDNQVYELKIILNYVPDQKVILHVSHSIPSNNLSPKSHRNSAEEQFLYMKSQGTWLIQFNNELVVYSFINLKDRNETR